MNVERSLLATMLLAASSAAIAHGSTTCEAVPPSQWKPQMELQAKLKAEGWKVRQVKVDHDCYEVYGFDDKGDRVEAFFHPQTLDRVIDADERASREAK